MKATAIIRLCAVVVMMTCMTNVWAQHTGFEQSWDNMRYSREKRDAPRERHQQIEEQLASRTAKAVVSERFMPKEEDNWWTDGRVCYRLTTLVNEKIHSTELHLAPMRTELGHAQTFTLNRQGRYVLKGAAGCYLQRVEAGMWTLLVLRNARNRAMQVFTRLDDEYFYEHDLKTTQRDLHDVYDGLYMKKDSDYVVFGLQRPHYPKTWNTDPGYFVGVPVPTEDNAYTDRIAYGGGRVSKGAPSSEKYQIKMPGGGGAGAIMHAMLWALRPTVAGIDVKILADEPFVSHHPRLKEQEPLLFVSSPYGDAVPGQWAFASVRPIGRGMLYRFSKDVLRLMRNAIYARHGHKFPSAPDIQQYFDAQNWYKPLSNPTPLTAIEQMNVQVIQEEENSRTE